MNYLDRIKNVIKGKKICVCPMGIAGKGIVDKFSSVGIKVDYFFDNNAALWGEEYKDIFCISKSELIKKRGDIIVVIESLYYKEIKKQLQSYGIENICRIYFEKITAEQYIQDNENTFLSEIEAVKDICSDEKSKAVFTYLTDAWNMIDISDDYFEKVMSKNQYFDEEIVHLNQEEVFVDCGAYIGDTAEKFLKACNNTFEKIHLFELDPAIYSKLLNKAAELQNSVKGIIQCYPYGTGELLENVFLKSGDSNSVIMYEGGGNRRIGKK